MLLNTQFLQSNNQFINLELNIFKLVKKEYEYSNTNKVFDWNISGNSVNFVKHTTQASGDQPIIVIGFLLVVNFM